MPISTTLFRKLSNLDPDFREVILLLVEEMEQQRAQLAQQVTGVEFIELKEVVAELAEAQRRTEERVNELAEAQRRTEARLGRLEEAVAALAEAQRRTEERVGRLEEAVTALAEAQRRTEERVGRLEEAVAALAEAQRRTEEELKNLAAEHKITRQRLEGISNAVGYTLEDRAFRSLPQRLQEEGVEVEGRLVRRYVHVRGKERQINIYGHGRKDGQSVLILGEAKVRPSRKEVDRFVRLAEQLAQEEGTKPFLLFVAYDFPPAIEAYVRSRGVLPVWSYELAI